MYREVSDSFGFPKHHCWGLALSHISKKAALRLWDQLGWAIEMLDGQREHLGFCLETQRPVVGRQSWKRYQQ